MIKKRMKERMKQRLQFGSMVAINSPHLSLHIGVVIFDLQNFFQLTHQKIRYRDRTFLGFPRSQSLGGRHLSLRNSFHYRTGFCCYGNEGFLPSSHNRSKNVLGLGRHKVESRWGIQDMISCRQRWRKPQGEVFPKST